MEVRRLEPGVAIADGGVHMQDVSVEEKEMKTEHTQIDRPKVLNWKNNLFLENNIQNNIYIYIYIYIKYWVRGDSRHMLPAPVSILPGIPDHETRFNRDSIPVG